MYLAGFTVTVYEVKLGALTYPVDPEFSNVTSTQLLAVGLIPGARYAFEVRAYTAAGAGELARTEADVSRTFCEFSMDVILRTAVVTMLLE